MAELPKPHRIVTKVHDLTTVPEYKSIERLAGVLFVDDILQHNHNAKIRSGRCEHCGYEMNYYDVVYYTVKSGIHSRQDVKAILSKPPREVIEVTFKDIQCVECGGAVTVAIDSYYCFWLTDPGGSDVTGDVKSPLPVQQP
jgi:hypothetical protein